MELFAGAGGLSLGLERAGLQCVAHAEIEPHARAVLRRHWPDVPLYGDVSQLRGADFPACGLLSGGSPCQDLSVAGKRAGIVDGVRSSLFFHQARLWDECGAPYLLWENVAGALSSNAGRDFALVLSTLVGAPVAVPGDGWRRGGVASGPAAVAAWRVCDLRYFGPRGFGPPQRRVRVFVLAARAGAADPAAILALSQGLCGHPDPRDAAGEGAAGAVGTSVAGGLGSHRTGGHRTDLDNAGCYPVQDFGNYGGDGLTLRAHGGDTGGGGEAIVVAGHTTHALTGEGCDASEDGTGRGTPLAVQPMTFDWQKGNDANNPRPSTMNVIVGQTNTLGSTRTPAVVQPFGWNQRNVTSAANRTTARPGMVGTIHADGGEVAQTLTDGGRSRGAGDSSDNTPVGVLQPWPAVAPTLSMGAHTAGPGPNGQDAEQWGELTTAYQDRPRRLMPLECERLMGWPDDHTAVGVDEQGRPYRLTDTPRYRLCGNGVGAPQAEWIGRRLMPTPHPAGQRVGEGRPRRGTQAAAGALSVGGISP